MPVKVRASEVLGEASAADPDVPEKAAPSSTASAGGLEWFENAQEQLKEVMNKSANTTDQIVAFHHGNLEAIMSSGKLWTQGMQDLSQHIASSAQASLDEAMKAVESLAKVKSVHEVVELELSALRSILEKAVAETRHISEASMKVAESSWAPLTERATVAVELFGKMGA